MDQEEITFGAFLAARMRERGISLKKLAEATGIAPIHLENLLHENFDEMPSSPYFRGYLIRIGKVLDFDGEAWWEKIKEEGLVKKSELADELPHNRFIKKIHGSTWAIATVVLIAIVYFIIAFPRIFGRPKLTVTWPSGSPYTTASTTITLQGTVSNADSLSLNDGEAIVIAPDGSWQKTVILPQTGSNVFVIKAKKLLGGETDVTEEIIYSSEAASSSTASSSSFPVVHTQSDAPATGT